MELDPNSVQEMAESCPEWTIEASEDIMKSSGALENVPRIVADWERMHSFLRELAEDGSGAGERARRMLGRTA